MKKLNRKGFTLVELLAVIIILAIVVGITIPAVLTTTQNAKKKTYLSAADNAADWFDRQYQALTTGVGTLGMTKVDGNFLSACGNDGSLCFSEKEFNLETATGDDLKIAKGIVSSAGLQVSDIKAMTVKINNGTGRTCVELIASPNGDYANLVTDDKVKSSICD